MEPILTVEEESDLKESLCCSADLRTSETLLFSQEIQKESLLENDNIPYLSSLMNTFLFNPNQITDYNNLEKSKMVKLTYVLIQANHIAEVPYSLSHRKNNPIVLICPGEKGKQFFEMLNANCNYKNVHPVTLEEYNNKSFESGSIVVILHPPSTF